MESATPGTLAMYASSPQKQPPARYIVLSLVSSNSIPTFGLNGRSIPGITTVGVLVGLTEGSGVLPVSPTVLSTTALPQDTSTITSATISAEPANNFFLVFIRTSPFYTGNYIIPSNMRRISSLPTCPSLVSTRFPFVSMKKELGTALIPYS